MTRRTAALLAAAVSIAAAGCVQTRRLVDREEGADAGDAIAMDCGACVATGVDLADLRCAIDLCDPGYVRNGDGAYAAVTGYRSAGMGGTCALEDTREALARFGAPSNDLAPRLNGSYAILATGDWDAVPHTTSCSPLPEGDPDAGPLVEDGFVGGDANKIMYDAVEWRLELRAPSAARSFSFDYVFFSTEYDEAISGLHSDKFYAILEAASTNAGAPTVINTTACRDEAAYFDFENEYGVKACYVAVNSALSECCWYGGCPDGTAETSIAGTGFECAGGALSDAAGNGSSTGWLRTAWPIEPGEEFAVTFHVHDTNDSSFDSAAIVDAFRFHTTANSGETVPVE